MAKILLVDDEPRIARVVRDMVEGAEWQFAYADNGADALDAVARDDARPHHHGRHDAEDGRIHRLPRAARPGASPCRSSSCRPKATSWTRASDSRPGATTTW